MIPSASSAVPALYAKPLSVFAPPMIRRKEGGSEAETMLSAASVAPLPRLTHLHPAVFAWDV